MNRTTHYGNNVGSHSHHCHFWFLFVIFYIHPTVPRAALSRRDDSDLKNQFPFVVLLYFQFSNETFLIQTFNLTNSEGYAFRQIIKYDCIAKPIIPRTNVIYDSMIILYNTF